MVQTRGRIQFTFAPDPGGNRAKRLAPRRVPAVPDSSIVSQVGFPAIVFTLAPRTGASAWRGAPQNGFQ